MKNHYIWFQRAQSYKNQKECIQKTFTLRMDDLVKGTLLALEQEREYIREAQDLEKDKLLMLEKTVNNYSRLHSWRQNKIKEMKEAEEQRLLLLENEKIQEQISEDDKNARRAIEKRKLELFYDNQKNKRELQQQIITQLAFKEQAEQIIKRRVIFELT